MKKWGLMILAVLVGCSTTEQSTQLYMLPEGNAVQANVVQTVGAQPSQPLLVIRNIEVADYLNGSGLVYRTSDTQIVQAKNNQWAENLSEQLSQRIVNDLRHKQTAYWPVKMTAAMDQAQQMKLQISVQRFNGSYTGNAEIVGIWNLIDGQGKIVNSAPFDLNVPLKEEGYSALVQALDQGVSQLTTTIAQSL